MKTMFKLAILFIFAITISCDSETLSNPDGEIEASKSVSGKSNEGFTPPQYFSAYICGEQVDFEVTTHYVGNFVSSTGGRLMFKSHWNEKGVGIGQTTGTVYQWSQVYNASGHTTQASLDDGSFLFSNIGTQRYNVVAQGGSSFILYFSYKLTYNAKGEVTVDRFDFKFEENCK